MKIVAHSRGTIVSLFWINNQANQQPQLVEHDTVSTLVVLGTTSLDHQLTQDSID